MTTAAVDADSLLAAPRGRRLCLELAEQLNPDVRVAAFHASRSTSDRVLRQNLLDAVAATDAGTIASWHDPLAFAEAMDFCVSSAMYWQPPDDWDFFLAHAGADADADADITEALRPVADAVIRAPAATWWSTPVDLTALRYTCGHDPDEAPSAPSLGDAAGQLRVWRERTVRDIRRADAEPPPADPARGVSGTWWSTPSHPSRLPSTTRPLPGVGSIALLWEEDSFGQRSAVVWPLTATAPRRVLEIHRPGDWVALVDRYPLDVTAARRYDWYRVSGRLGRWLIPDWPAVAADWDAVHVSVAGYLTTATRALPLPDAAGATMLAGWDPDETWWLTDVLQHAGPPEHWTCPDGEWQRVS